LNWANRELDGLILGFSIALGWIAAFALVAVAAR